MIVAPLGYLLAALLGGSALLLSLLIEGRWRRPRRALLPVLGPVMVLVAMEVLPHLVNPCLVAGALGDDLPSGCSRTVHGIDVHDRWHALHHAVVGGLPASLGYAALLRRRRPELFTRSDEASPPVPVRESAAARLQADDTAASGASTDSGLGRRPTRVTARAAVLVPVTVRIAAAAAALGGAAWIVKAGAILVTGNQPPLVFEAAPLLFAVGLLGLRAMLTPAGTTRIGGWAAAVAAVLGAASLVTGVGSTSSDGDFSPLVFATFLCTLAGLVLLGLAARRRPGLPRPVRTLPLLLGLLTLPLLAVGGALALINERLLEVPLLVLGLAWILLGHSIWMTGVPSAQEASTRHRRPEHATRRQVQ